MKKYERMILNTIDIQTWYLKDPEIYGKVNQAHAEFLGFNKEEIENKEIIDLFSEKEAKSYIQGNKNVFIKKKKVHSEEWLENSGGEKRLLSITKTPKITKKDEVECVVCSAEDITEKAKQRKELDLMNFTVNKSNLLIFRVNHEGIIEYVNETVLDKLGYEKKELIGKNILKIVKTDSYVKRKVFWKKIKNSNVITYERKFIAKDGSKFPVEITSQYFNYENKEYEFVFSQDITERKKQEEKLKKQKAYFEQLFNNSTEAIVLLDNNHQVIKTNEKFESLFGFKQSELANKNLDNFILPDNFVKEGKNYTEEVKQGEKIRKESIRKTKSGEKINVFLQGFPIKLANGHIGIYALYRDITERKEKEEQIKYLSFHDEMTELYNRRYFENELKRLNSSRRHPITIVIGDLDNLKTVNDNYGHNKGDEYIINAANILKSIVRSEDIIARIGGDEFAIILPSTNYKEAKNFCQRIQKKFKEFNNDRNFVKPLSISLGFEVMEDSSQNLNKVFNKADQKMYINKGRK